MNRDVERELIRTALPYWETEAHITRRFFNGKPSREDHIFWLKAQLWKELHPVDGYFTGIQKELSQLIALFPRIDKDIDRHRYQYLLGRPISAEDTFQLPQEKKLAELRRGYANSGSAVDKAAVLVTEGGGARMFREGRKLGGSPLERMIAKAMEVIYQDEKNHYKEAAREAAHAVKNRRDLPRMKKAIREISRQRVDMRNEMFRQPLTSEEIKNRLK